MASQLKAYQLNYLSFNASKTFCSAGQPTYQFDISQNDPPNFSHHMELASTKGSKGCLHLVTEMLGLGLEGLLEHREPGDSQTQNR